MHKVLLTATVEDLRGSLLILGLQELHYICKYCQFGRITVEIEKSQLTMVFEGCQFQLLPSHTGTINFIILKVFILKKTLQLLIFFLTINGSTNKLQQTLIMNIL